MTESEIEALAKELRALWMFRDDWLNVARHVAEREAEAELRGLTMAMEKAIGGSRIAIDTLMDAWYEKHDPKPKPCEHGHVLVELTPAGEMTQTCRDCRAVRRLGAWEVPKGKSL